MSNNITIENLIEQVRDLIRYQGEVRYDTPIYDKFHKDITEFVFAHSLDETEHWELIQRNLMWQSTQFMLNEEANQILTGLENMRLEILKRKNGNGNKDTAGGYTDKPIVQNSEKVYDASLMKDVFIKNIHVDKVRHLSDFNIVLSKEERKHLIITGKNGSGKTSLLEAMRNNINDLQTYYHESTAKPYGIDISYSKDFQCYKNYFFVYIPTIRKELIIPKSIESLTFSTRTPISSNISQDFLKYILNLDYRIYGAKSDNNKELELKLTKWFDNFHKALCAIYNCSELKVQRDTKNLVFKIDMPGRQPFALNEMADGYQSFLNIYMELLMRLENDDDVDYEQSAIVIIDEIETHLHVELQKQVLPFLTKMFPNIQFIVSTHSPFVITSLSNAVVYDLEKRERLENPSFYSYETVIESFFDTSMYSTQLVNYLNRYKELCFKDRTDEENEEFLQARDMLALKSLPTTELYIKFQELEMKRKALKNGKVD